MSKRVYLFNGAEARYNGFWDCQESPLEEGVYISPVDSTEIEPPTFDALVTDCQWDGTQWVLTTIKPSPETVPEPVEGD